MLMLLRTVLSGLAVVMVTLPAFAEDLPEDYDIITIPNRSDERVNDSRIFCASGQLQVANQRMKAEYGIGPRDAAAFCPAIVAEAVNRGNDADLYSVMQPGRAAEELQAVLVAAAKGRTHYVNASGVKKRLSCHLAFDVGYIYGHANPDQPIMSDLTDMQIDDLIERCYDTQEGITPNLALWAGARLAQRHSLE